MYSSAKSRFFYHIWRKNNGQIWVLFLIRGELVEAVLAEVGPVVVGGAVGCDGEGGLFLVEQYLDEHVFVLGIAAVENKLQVAGHGEHAAAPPAAGFEIVEIVGGEVVAVNTNQAYQWEQNRFVAKA